KLKVEALRTKLLTITNELQVRQEELEKATKKLNDKKSNSDITSNVMMQMNSTLQPYGVKLAENNQSTTVEKITKAFDTTLVLYAQLSSIQTTKGKFYLANGSVVEGDIVKVGNIAAFGISTTATGALAPAGNGNYKLWNAVDSSDDAKALFAKEMLPTLDIFVYENLDKEVEYQKEKTLGDTLKAGGMIGYIILALGAFGLLLLVYRSFLLSRSGGNVEKITGIVLDKVNARQGSAEALEAIKEYSGSTARVIKATLRNIGKNREHVEDIIMENILNESSRIDKYGNFVLVIAAVAPLLGLLGTVTGMIATFDIITEHGTGDPKLLSGGISEALVTTMLGLIVAIPLLLLGNLLSGWAQSIKDSMEHSALHIVNLFEKNNLR
ncbi:MAG: MotA/TolQ/ExbB proton channel family protein, partial [Campylobacterota bacterium]|nr:MotA/TolQ/ExbB proton channel family protein [Campylobacterota bacterium]